MTQPFGAPAPAPAAVEAVKIQAVMRGNAARTSAAMVEASRIREEARKGKAEASRFREEAARIKAEVLARQNQQEPGGAVPTRNIQAVKQDFETRNHSRDVSASQGEGDCTGV